MHNPSIFLIVFACCAIVRCKQVQPLSSAATSGMRFDFDEVISSSYFSQSVARLAATGNSVDNLHSDRVPVMPMKEIVRENRIVDSLCVFYSSSPFVYTPIKVSKVAW